MSPVEAADRIVAALLAGTGPILLLVPGTLGTEYQTSMLALGRASLRLAGTRPLCVASIPYSNGIGDIVTRFLHLATKPDENVLSLVLRRLRRFAPDREVYLAGESQGAWLVADTLRAEPDLAAGVTRIAMFAKPGFVTSPSGVGGAADATTGARGIVEWRHDDDVVPNLFSGIGTAVLGAVGKSLAGLVTTGAYHYKPHHYDRYGATAASWLLDGIRPTRTSLMSTDPLPDDAPGTTT